jgi:hypothetical protein
VLANDDVGNVGCHVGSFFNCSVRNLCLIIVV